MTAFAQFRTTQDTTGCVDFTMRPTVTMSRCSYSSPLDDGAYTARQLYFDSEDREEAVREAEEQRDALEACYTPA